MRLTADLLQSSEIFVNCLKDRELYLRGHKIPQIENLGVIGDQIDTINLIDNEVKSVDNFPLLKRLHTLLLDNNRVSSITPGLSSSIPSLRVLSLTNNQIGKLSDVDALSEFACLENLSLLNNPVCRRNHYRMYVIHKLPKLRVLDFQKIKRSERENASELFGDQSVTKPASNTSKAQNSKAELSADKKEMVKRALLNAVTAEQIDKLEKILSSGVVPSEAELAELTSSTVPTNVVGNAVAAPKVVSDGANKANPVPNLATSKVEKSNSIPPNVATSNEDDTTESNSISKVASNANVNSPMEISGSTTTIAKNSPNAGQETVMSTVSPVVHADNGSNSASGSAEIQNTSDVPSTKRSPRKGASPSKTSSKRSKVDDSLNSTDMEVDQVGDSLTAAEIAQFKVAELKAELSKRGIVAKGRKAELVEKLKAAVGI